MGISVEPEDLNDPAYLRGLEAGQKIAEERIIKLLESYKCPCYCEVHIVLDPVIALIKGENK
jgi:hypothetical protein